MQGRWIAIAALLVAGVMNLIDITIVNEALPSMQVDLFPLIEGRQLDWPIWCWLLPRPGSASAYVPVVE